MVVQPLNAEEIQNVLRYCYSQNIPVTVRGAGTGNYGQAVPLQGGMVLDLARMDGSKRSSRMALPCASRACGWALETEARKTGWELRCYPSTMVKASVGGFLGGGSGGIGSVPTATCAISNGARAGSGHHGAGTAHVLHEGQAVHEILHAWGTNGVITRIWLALAPAVDWSQCVVAFDTFDAAFDFSEKIADGNSGPSGWSPRSSGPFLLSSPRSSNTLRRASR